jgi:prophage regulatory protein
MQKRMAGHGAPSGTSRLLLWPQVRQLVPLSRTTIWRAVRNKSFPAPIKISSGRVAWLEADIRDWISNQRRVSCGEARFETSQLESKIERARVSRA